MKHKNLLLISFALIAVLLTAALNPGMAMASSAFQEDETVDLTGVITALDAESGVLALEVEEGGETVTYKLIVGEEFDFSAVGLGSEVEISGTIDGENTVIVTDITSKAEEIVAENADTESFEEGYFCSGESDFNHPVAQAIATLYGATYDEVMDFFCSGSGDSARTGLGQIMLAYQTAEVTGGSAADILAQRGEGTGWGQIWQESIDGFGKPDDAGKPEDVGDPEDAGEPEDVGAPEDVVPEDAGESEDVGTPEDAGKPEGAGRP